MNLRQCWSDATSGLVTDIEHLGHKVSHLQESQLPTLFFLQKSLYLNHIITNFYGIVPKQSFFFSIIKRKGLK